MIGRVYHTFGRDYLGVAGAKMGMTIARLAWPIVRVAHFGAYFHSGRFSLIALKMGRKVDTPKSGLPNYFRPIKFRPTKNVRTIYFLIFRRFAPPKSKVLSTYLVIYHYLFPTLRIFSIHKRRKQAYSLLFITKIRSYVTRAHPRWPRP